MTTHDIKCKPEYFEPLLAELKTAEIRENDRDYQIGDTLTIREFGPQGYTGRVTHRQISHVLRDFPALSKNYVMLSLI